MPSLRKALIRLAYSKPEFREHLLPLLKEGASKTKTKYWTCPECSANFPGPADKPLIMPRHRWRNEICPGTGQPGE